MNNSGIYMTGNATLKAQQVVVGDYTTTMVTTHASSPKDHERWTDLKAKLDELSEQIAATGQLPHKEDVLASTASVAQALTAEKPNKITVMGMLSGIGDAVKSVSGIFASVEAIKLAVAALL